jgi:photosystem II stability/assembly factor-like uncharacterized protein
MVRPSFVHTFLFLSLLLITTDGVAQWEPITQLRGRDTKRILSSGPGLYSLVRENGGYSEYYRSLDSGQTWTRLTALSGKRVGRFEVSDALVVAIIYPGASSPNEVMVSTDFGQSFSTQLFDRKADTIFYPTIIAFGKDKIYIGGGSGTTSQPNFITILSSKDSGRSWQTDPTNYDKLDMLLGLYEFGDYLFATSGRTLYRKHLTTLQLDSLPIPSQSSSTEARWFTTDSDYLYIGGNMNVVRSSDTGLTWDTISFNGNKFYRTGEYYYAGDMIYDAELNWYRPKYYKFWNFAEDYAVQGDYWLVATEEGLFRSKIGEDDWSILDTNMTSARAMKIYAYDDITYAITESGLHISTDEGTTWKRQPQAGDLEFKSDGSNVSWLSGPPDDLWTIARGLIMRSKDTGRTWEQLEGPQTGSTMGVITQAGSTLIGSQGRMHRTTNGGATWSVRIWDYVQFHPVNAGSVIYMTHSEEPIDWTTDRGASWGSSKNPFFNSKPRKFAADGPNILAQFTDLSGDTLYRSTNRGTTWTRLTRTPNFYGTIALKGKRAFIAIGGNSLDSSSDFGNSWQTMSDSLPSPITSITVTNNYLFVTTEDHGAFRITTKPAASVSSLLPAVDPIVVSQDLNGKRVTLSYRDDSELQFRNNTVEILDVTGHSFTLPFVTSDDHSMILDVSTLASGFYLARLEINGRIATAPFVIQR